MLKYYHNCFLLAGYDTVFNALSFITYCLASNPQQQQPFQLSPQQIEEQRGIGLEKQKQIAAMQAPQVQQAPVMAAYGGIMKGYK